MTLFRCSVKFILTTVMLLIGGIYTSAQNDSLNDLIRSAPHDSVRARLCNEFSATVVNSDVKSGVYFAQSALTYAVKTRNKIQEAFGYINLGYAVYYAGDGDSAMALYRLAIQKGREAGDSNAVVTAYNRSGFTLRQKGDKVKALEFYNLALKSNKQESNVSEAGFTYLNIGLIYHDEGQFENALKNEERGLEFYQRSGEEVKVANAYARLGNLYVDWSDTTKGLECYNKSLALFEKNHHLRGVGICLNNIAGIYDGRHDYKTAMDYYYRAVKLREQIGDKNGICLATNNIGRVYKDMKIYDSAFFYLRKSLDLALELDYKDIMATDYISLSEAYEATGDPVKALSYFKLYHATNDSLFNIQSRDQINELNAKFESKDREKQIEQLKTETSLKNAALDQEKKRNLFMIAAVFLLVLLAFAIWRNAVRSRRANVELEKRNSEIAAQKKIAEEQHGSILDSINYAKRIQHAVLPTTEERLELFPESFVFYRPRDIVSGDFYWMNRIDGKKILVVGDCTGHGVPGAFMSLIGNTLLDEIINQKQIIDPGMILDQLSEAIVHSLKQKESSEPAELFSVTNVKDGMDIALCVIDEKNNEILFAGANNPLLYISNGQLSELKGDRQPIGFYDAEKKPFRTQRIPLAGTQRLYLFTDGVTDQFGGKDGKKFRLSRLKEEITKFHERTLEQQGVILEKLFDDWRSGMDQIDDVCVVGVGV